MRLTLFYIFLMSTYCLSSQLPAKETFTTAASAFNAEFAFMHIEKQCSFGPRVSKMPGHKKCRDYIVSELKKNGLKPKLQPFDAYSKMMGRVLPFENIIAKLDTPSTNAIALSCHWDSRPISDRDKNPSVRRYPILGANDGASGVAALLEISRVLKENPPPVDVYFLFFDAEDYGTNYELDQYCLGSQHFVKNQPKDFKIEVGVNLDLIADFNQEFFIEEYSLQTAEKYTNQIWKIGNKHYPKNFKFEKKSAILDDHVPFIKAGIPYLDVIDLDYDHWHTSQDTPENCSMDSLERAGKVIIEWIFLTFRSE